jgi:hypothetical protein
MLTRRDYEDLWETHFTGVGIRKTSKEDDNPNNCPNDYCDYLIREHMFEDYLDIFRGVNTRDHRTIKLCEEWYYPHPYFENNICLIDTPALKYIMIGEAAPSKCGTYFFDINQINNTAWLSAPLNAFFNADMTTVPYIKPKTSIEKRDLLLELANQGYLLIDLFPFAVNYKNIRQNLNITGASEFFYKRLQTKIGDILKGLKEGQNADIKVAFSGPPTVHHYLANKINIGSLRLLTNLICHTIPNSLNLKGSFPPPTQQPYFLCCTYDATNQNPHELFIRNAFDLP